MNEIRQLMTKYEWISHHVFYLEFISALAVFLNAKQRFGYESHRITSIS